MRSAERSMTATGSDVSSTFIPFQTHHSLNPRKLLGFSCHLIALSWHGLSIGRQSLAHLVDIAMKHEQAIGVGGARIGEFIPLALLQLHLQYLREIVDLEDLEIIERHTEAVALVVGVVA